MRPPAPTDFAAISIAGNSRPPTPAAPSLLFLLVTKHARLRRPHRVLIAAADESFAFDVLTAMSDAVTAASSDDLTKTFGVLLIGFIFCVVLYGLTFFRTPPYSANCAYSSPALQKRTFTLLGSPLITLGRSGP